MADKQKEGSALGTLFALVGGMGGCAAATDQGETGTAIMVTMAVLAIIGYVVGALVEAVVIRLVFVAVVVVTFLLNAAVRQFVWSLVSSLVGSGEVAA
ncbi:hypothetical protein [Engelhardtia mirabilis]|uniref:Uncharacterized protein n=1 Tax=Engelhardtia mirabilis TaxID=2528011 RepID=A0A518BRF6_9BACT|nr:hypothetical protein Pla133_46500 [Planctomycetes bacterium Pla133]QDV03856.1 hypothetical protein Pla86_46480 [Planctomycetes bacterium Pla86]